MMSLFQACTVFSRGMVAGQLADLGSVSQGEVLGATDFFGEMSLRNALRDFLAQFHAERNHEELYNQLIEPSVEVGDTTGEIRYRERLGGLLRYYCREAA